VTCLVFATTLGFGTNTNVPRANAQAGGSSALTVIGERRVGQALRLTYGPTTHGGTVEFLVDGQSIGTVAVVFLGPNAETSWTPPASGTFSFRAVFTRPGFPQQLAEAIAVIAGTESTATTTTTRSPAPIPPPPLPPEAYLNPANTTTTTTTTTPVSISPSSPIAPPLSSQATSSQTNSAIVITQAATTTTVVIVEPKQHDYSAETFAAVPTEFVPGEQTRLIVTKLVPFSGIVQFTAFDNTPLGAAPVDGTGSAAINVVFRGEPGFHTLFAKHNIDGYLEKVWPLDIRVINPTPQTPKPPTPGPDVLISTPVTTRPSSAGNAFVQPGTITNASATQGATSTSSNGGVTSVSGTQSSQARPATNNDQSSSAAAIVNSEGTNLPVGPAKQTATPNAGPASAPAQNFITGWQPAKGTSVASSTVQSQTGNSGLTLTSASDQRIARKLLKVTKPTGIFDLSIDLGGNADVPGSPYRADFVRTTVTFLSAANKVLGSTIFVGATGKVTGAFVAPNKTATISLVLIDSNPKSNTVVNSMTVNRR
jgi:hypothetical protein